jgi:hypothetical protein
MDTAELKKTGPRLFKNRKFSSKPLGDPKKYSRLVAIYEYLEKPTTGGNLQHSIARTISKWNELRVRLHEAANESTNSELVRRGSAALLDSRLREFAVNVIQKDGMPDPEAPMTEVQMERLNAVAAMVDLFIYQTRLTAKGVLHPEPKAAKLETATEDTN